MSRICYLELLGCPGILSQLKGMLKWHHKNLYSSCRIQATTKINAKCRGCTICTMYLSQPRCRLRKWRATTMAPAAATDLRTHGTWILTIISLWKGKAGLWGSKGISDVMNLNRTPFPRLHVCMVALLAFPEPLHLHSSKLDYLHGVPTGCHTNLSDMVYCQRRVFFSRNIGSNLGEFWRNCMDLNKNLFKHVPQFPFTFPWTMRNGLVPKREVLEVSEAPCFCAA